MNKSFREELDRVCRAYWKEKAVIDVSASTLKLHKARCTLDVIVRTDQGLHNLIAKVHSEDRSDIYLAMEKIRDAGFSSPAKFRIPLALAYLPSLNVLLEEKIQGATVKDILLNTDSYAKQRAAEECAAWLARFHATAPRAGETLEPSQIVFSLKRWTDLVRKSGEPIIVKCEALLRKIETAASLLDAVEPRAGHGSYIPEHVFLNPTHSVVIDFDEHNTADPSRDLAVFIVSLKRLGLRRCGTIHFFDQIIEKFLTAYGALSSREALSHLAFHEAAQFLHKASKDLYKWDTPLREQAEIMVEEGFAALENGP